MNVDLVCQSAPKEPLWTRVSGGAVATVITACGFVTSDFSFFSIMANSSLSCNSDYRLRFCNSSYSSLLKEASAGGSCNSDYRLRFCNCFSPKLIVTSSPLAVATVITACGFVTL